MTTTRREFLQTTAALAACTGLAPLAAPLRRERAAPALVAVYLRGGADFLNMLIPYRDPAYRAARPGIGLGEEDGVLPLDDQFALHPALAALRPLYQDKRLAPVICTGSPHPTRSHFEAQDFMEYAAPGNHGVREGWISRYLRATARPGASEFRAVALQANLPRALRGEFPALAVPEGKRRRNDVLEQFDSFYGGEGGAVSESGRRTIDILRRFHEIAAAAPAGKEAAYPDADLARRLKTIAGFIRAGAGLEVVGLDYDGWDHHAGQGGIGGRHAEMLRTLAESLAAFYRDLGPHADATLTLCMTEFGRTVRENGNDGTDHGRGGGMLLLGGGVRGGKVYGDWRGLEAKALIEGRDLPVTTDFRDVFASCLAGCFGFEPPRDFFPDYTPALLAAFRR
ncbi:MAG: DUF1501 domain-containing protein [Planctomycetota bacterium]|nr:MAG: DUF1501 domain-containing protein [Planctomycetota bacterium]